MPRVYTSFSQYGAPTPVPVWKPKATYGLLIAMAATYVLQLASLAFADSAWLHQFLFVVAPDWLVRPWSPATSTFAHSPVDPLHILFNGMMLWFFGPLLERIMGRRQFVTAFLVAGAMAGILQVTITGGGALGASGAIMMVFGALATIMPKQTILIFGIVPAPFWAAAAGYAVLDVVGALGPGNGIGNIAHLTGMALGVWLGWRIKQSRVTPRFQQSRPGGW